MKLCFLFCNSTVILLWFTTESDCGCFLHSEKDYSDSLNAWLKIFNKILNFVVSGNFRRFKIHSTRRLRPIGKAHRKKLYRFNFDLRLCR